MVLHTEWFGIRRLHRLQLATALALRAALDAWTGVQTRDVGWLESAQFSAQMALALFGSGLSAV